MNPSVCDFSCKTKRGQARHLENTSSLIIPVCSLLVWSVRAEQSRAEGDGREVSDMVFRFPSEQILTYRSP